MPLVEVPDSSKPVVVETAGKTFDLSKLLMALTQLTSAGVMVATLFGQTIPPERLAAINGALGQILGSIVLLASFLPSIVHSLKGIWKEVEEA